MANGNWSDEDLEGLSADIRRELTNAIGRILTRGPEQDDFIRKIEASDAARRKRGNDDVIRTLQEAKSRGDRLAGFAERIAIALEAIVVLLEREQVSLDSPFPPFNVEREREAPRPWRVELWSKKRGVLMESHEDEEPLKVGRVFVIGGVDHVVIEVQNNPGHRVSRGWIEPRIGREEAGT